MPRFYFHHRSNGQLEEDQRGLQFPNADKALTHAIRRTSDALGHTLSSTANTYITIEVTDGERSLCVVRGTVIVGGLLHLESLSLIVFSEVECGLSWPAISFVVTI
jgi:hypothetical protein